MRKPIFRNCNGEVIEIPEGGHFPVRDERFLKPDGKVDWTQLEYADGYGFDIRHRYSDGRYKHQIVLPPGTRIIRYGLNTGSFTAKYNTEYERLSLPFVKEALPYHEFVVLCECSVIECFVEEGIVAPGFGSVGGVTQYRHPEHIDVLLDKKVLKEDFSWIK